MKVEKSFRRVGFRRIGASGALCCTEGHFESAEMNAFIRRKRLEYLERMGKHLGAGDMQYANDCAVRFTRLAELVHENWGRGYEHMRKVLTDHATFPRAVCRHMGPDTAAYDRTMTQPHEQRERDPENIERTEDLLVVPGEPAWKVDVEVVGALGRVARRDGREEALHPIEHQDQDFDHHDGDENDSQGEPSGAGGREDAEDAGHEDGRIMSSAADARSAAVRWSQGLDDRPLA